MFLRIRSTVALISHPLLGTSLFTLGGYRMMSLCTLGPFNYNGWIGALTTEGQDLFTLIKHHQTHGDKTPLFHIIDPG